MNEQPSSTARLLSLLPWRADWAALPRQPGRDLLAGMTVAVVAVPLAAIEHVRAGLS